MPNCARNAAASSFVGPANGRGIDKMARSQARSPTKGAGTPFSRIIGMMEENSALIGVGKGWSRV